MKSKLGNILIAAAVGLVAGFFIGRYSVPTEIVEVPVTIEVPVPVVKNDTVVIRPEPVRVEVPNPVNSDLLAQYDQLKDTLAKRDAFINAITKRTYNETFEDDIQTIDVVASVTGSLDSLGVSYETKPRIIPVDTVVKVEVPAPKRSLSVSLQTAVLQLGNYGNYFLEDGLYGGVGVGYKDRKGNTFGGIVDSKKQFLLTYSKDIIKF